MNHSGIDIDAVVAEVLRRLDVERRRDEPRHTPPAAAPRVSTPSETPTPAISNPGISHPTAAPAGELRLEEPLLTWAQVQDRLSGITRVVVPRRCVVTPAARDGLRSAGIELQRGENSANPTKRRSLKLFAHAVDVDVSGVMESVQSGFARVELSRETDLSRIVNVANSAVTAGLAVVITRQAPAALILANRRRSLRAILAGSLPQLSEAARSTAANLLVIDPAGRSELELTRQIQEFDRAATTDCPAWLR